VDVAIAQRQSRYPILPHIPSDDEQAAVSFLVQQSYGLTSQVEAARAETMKWVGPVKNPDSLRKEQFDRLYVMIKEKYKGSADVDLGVAAADTVFDYLVELVPPAAHGVITPLIAWLELEQAQSLATQTLNSLLTASDQRAAENRRASAIEILTLTGMAIHLSDTHQPFIPS